MCTATLDAQAVPARDRRNNYAREGLRRAVQARFTDDRLEMTAHRAARVFVLPPALCERVLDELAGRGGLVRSPAGVYTIPG